MDDVNIQIATKDDLNDLIKYLSLDIIDNSFVKPLSQRNISIYDRVYKYFNNGFGLF